MGIYGGYIQRGFHPVRKACQVSIGSSGSGVFRLPEN